MDVFLIGEPARVYDHMKKIAVCQFLKSIETETGPPNVPLIGNVGGPGLCIRLIRSAARGAAGTVRAAQARAIDSPLQPLEVVRVVAHHGLNHRAQMLRRLRLVPCLQDLRRRIGHGECLVSTKDSLDDVLEGLATPRVP